VKKDTPFSLDDDDEIRRYTNHLDSVVSMDLYHDTKIYNCNTIDVSNKSLRLPDH
jgi:hypothetical protein